MIRSISLLLETFGFSSYIVSLRRRRTLLRMNYTLMHIERRRFTSDKIFNTDLPMHGILSLMTNI